MKATILILAVFLTLMQAVRARADDAATQPSDPSAGVPSTQPSTDSRATPMTVEMLEHLQKTLKGVATIEADFVQEKKLKVLDHPLIIKGHFALQKPDRLIWNVREPIHYVVRLEGEEVRQWDEDTNRVDVIHLGGDPTFRAVSDQIRAWFLGNYEGLAKSYDVVVLGENPLSLRFTPKDDTMVAKVLKQVEVRFSPDERNIEQMTVHEAGGDSATIRYFNTKINQPISDDEWRIPPNENQAQ